jgi:hypothetical protein
MVGHRANVWIGIDSVLILLGGALLIAAWQRVPAASTTNSHPTLWAGASTAIPFIVGMVLVVLGLYVLAAFFWPLPLPRIRQEREAAGQEERASRPVVQLPPGSHEVRDEGERTIVRRLTDEEARPPRRDPEAKG